MKKIVSILMFIPIILSCIFYANPPLGETNFPLKKVLTIPVGEDIEEIAVGDTWIAVRTKDTIIAIDIDTFKTLWTLDAQVSALGQGFQMANDMVITASEEQIFLIDRQGNKKDVDVEVDVKQIIDMWRNNSSGA